MLDNRKSVCFLSLKRVLEDRNLTPQDLSTMSGVRLGLIETALQRISINPDSARRILESLGIKDTVAQNQGIFRYGPRYITRRRR
jgi:predicted transcriptional regulator